MSLDALLARAAKAKRSIAYADTASKNALLQAMAAQLRAQKQQILQANAADLAAVQGKISDVMQDRLRLTDARIEGMAAGLESVAALPDPVGNVVKQLHRPNGLLIEKVTVPMGVIAIIYESRPNVTADAAALCLKAGATAAGFDPDVICLVEDTTRESANELMTAEGKVDLLIPRGGAGLIRACVENATVPCIETGTGICHIYVDKAADLDMAVSILFNAKTSRPSVCNAAEVCLVHRDIAAAFLPLAAKKLAEKQVELRLDEAAAKIISGKPANEHDFDTEFLDYILGVKVVDDLAGAIAHIAAHSTHHSDAIVTADEAAAQQFVREVDSAAVYVNASTRFTDGGEFGQGCEMGISTQKVGARGPMGLEEITTYKYVVRGSGQIR